jgi:glutathione peroxidase
MQDTFHNFCVNTIAGSTFDFKSLKGKKVMIVNTASQCGLTPQFEQLEQLYQQKGGAGFEIIGFPTNDFASQDPGTNEEIASFCQINYGVTFKMMEKIIVKGANKHPLYQWLTSKALNGKEDCEIQWNFQKFLIDENGNWIKNISPETLPIDVEILNWLEN